MRVVIVGGGIAGLAAAYYLQEKTRARGMALQYTLVESAPRWGGKILTEKFDDFIIEAGPDSFLTQRPAALELCRQLGLSDRLIGTNDGRRKTFVVRRGRLHELPEGLSLIVPTRLGPFLRSPLLSPFGKLRVGLDWFIPGRVNGDESLASFVRRRFGIEMLERIADPLLAGIYVGDPECLSIQSTFPRLVDLERKYGSLIRGARRNLPQVAQPARGRASSSAFSGTTDDDARGSMFMSLRGGLSELVDALVSRLDAGSLLSGRRASRLEIARDAYTVYLDDGRSLDADALVLATPAFVSANLLAPHDTTLADALRSIHYLSSATVSVAYHRSEVNHPLDGFGFIVPRRESRHIIACTWTTTKFDGRAPREYVLLRAFVGGARNEHLVAWDDAALVDRVRAELRELMGITAQPVLAKVYRWEKANPQYEIGHLERIAHIEALCNVHPGLFLAGSAYRGVGIADCVMNGALIAEQIAKRGSNEPA